MSGYGIAWVVIGVCAVLGALGVHRLFRSAHPLVRWGLIVVTVVFFVTPAQVPNYPGHIAPAFVVLIFEAFFQTEGEPQGSLRILGLAIFVGMLVAVGGYFVYSRTIGGGSDRSRRRGGQSPPIS